MRSLLECSKEHVLITAHGGYNSGIITFNSLPGFEAAVKAGADIVELDVVRSVEGKLYVFHHGTERRMLGYDCDVTRMTNAEIEALRNQASDLPIPSLDDVLETLKGRCFINTDKAYSCFTELIREIRRHRMEEQIILKGDVNDKEIYDMTEELAPDIAFLTISTDTDNSLEICRGRKINHVGSEVVFADDTAPVAQSEYIEMMHKNGKLIWANSILFWPTRLLVGGHDDHTSLLGQPENGWGWLADRGYDIIQTDWVTDCISYLKRADKYNKTIPQ